MGRAAQCVVASLTCLAVLAGMSAPVRVAAASGREHIRAGVIVLDFDPLMDDGQPLTAARAWNDPPTLEQQYVSDVSAASDGIVKHRIVHTSVVRQYPAKPGGFQFTNSAYLACLAGPPTDDCKALIDYGAVLNTAYDAKSGSACDGLRHGRADEVWLWGGPWFGYLEWLWVAPGTLCPDVRKAFVVMGFSYERGEAEMMHDLGHRAEGLVQAGIGLPLWDRFDGQRSRYGQDFACPDQPDSSHPEVDPTGAHAGNVHFPPNAFCHYQYDRDFAVMSDADDWSNFPNLTGRRTLINSATWGGTQRGFMIWWLGRFPRNTGSTLGVENDWWRYVYVATKGPRSARA